MPTGPRPYTLRAAQVLAVHRQNNQPAVCGIDFIGPLGWERPALLSVVATFATAWANNVMPLLSVSCVFERVDARGLRGPNDAVVDFPLTTPAGGGSPALARDNQQATVISKRTAVSGKGGRGRVYLPGLPEVALAGGFINSDYREDCAAALDVVADAVRETHAGWLPVVISYQLNKVWRPQPATYEITSWESRTAYPGSMNGRRPD